MPPDDAMPPVSPQNLWKRRLLIYGPFISGLVLMAGYLGLKYAALRGMGEMPFDAMLYAIGVTLCLFGSIPVVAFLVGHSLEAGGWAANAWLVKAVGFIAILSVPLGLGKLYQHLDDHFEQSALRDLGIDACFPVFERDRYDMKGGWTYRLRGPGAANELVILHIRRKDNGELLIGDTICVRYLPAHRSVVEEMGIRENPAVRIPATAMPR